MEHSQQYQKFSNEFMKSFLASTFTYNRCKLLHCKTSWNLNLTHQFVREAKAKKEKEKRKKNRIRHEFHHSVHTTKLSIIQMSPRLRQP